MLTDTSIRAAKPKDKPYKLSDGGGLYLLIGASGSKIWKWKYRHDGKEKLLTIGPYPIISLREARETRDKAKGDLLRRIEPLARKVAAESDLGMTFRGITSEWLEKKAKTWAAVTAKSNVMMIGGTLCRTYQTGQREAYRPWMRWRCFKGSRQRGSTRQPAAVASAFPRLCGLRS